MMCYVRRWGALVRPYLMGLRVGLRVGV